MIGYVAQGPVTQTVTLQSSYPGSNLCGTHQISAAPTFDGFSVDPATNILTVHTDNPVDARPAELMTLSVSNSISEKTFTVEIICQVLNLKFTSIPGTIVYEVAQGILESTQVIVA